MDGAAPVLEMGLSADLLRRRFRQMGEEMKQRRGTIPLQFLGESERRRILAQLAADQPEPTPPAPPGPETAADARGD
jgi:hypothetical protein